MFNTFNMGIGFVVMVSPEQATQACQHFEAEGIAAYDIGEVVAGDGGVLDLPTA